MISKRFIYRNGKLIPKNQSNSEQKGNITDDKLNIYQILNVSRNSNLINPPNIIKKFFLSDLKISKNIPSSKTQEEKKIIHECNNINEETQTNSTFQLNNIINKYNEDKTNDSNIENYKEKEESLFKQKQSKIIKKPKKPKKATLYWQIEQICRHIYLNQSNDNKNNIYNEMYQKENEFIKNLNKNVLNNDDLILRKKKSCQNFSRLIKSNINEKTKSSNHYKIKNNLSYNSNKINQGELMKIHNNKENNDNIIDNKNKKENKYNIKNYGINSYRQKHSQFNLYKSNSKIKLPAIKKSKSPIELVNIIPFKQGSKKDEKLNEYKFFKEMKKNRLKKFHM